MVAASKLQHAHLTAATPAPAACSRGEWVLVGALARTLREYLQADRWWGSSAPSQPEHEEWAGAWPRTVASSSRSSQSSREVSSRNSASAVSAAAAGSVAALPPIQP